VRVCSESAIKGSFRQLRRHGPQSPGLAIAGTPKDCYEPGMEELFGDPAYKGFVLQDHKRLPSRFFARVSGALTSRRS
jgi:hypothetical protein